MATKKRARAVVGPSKLAGSVFARWARPGAPMALEHLESELPDERRYDLVAALRELEKLGAGELVAGKGHRSRFVWSDKAALSAVQKQHGLSESTARAATSRIKPAKVPASSVSPHVEPRGSSASEGKTGQAVPPGIAAAPEPSPSRGSAAQSAVRAASRAAPPLEHAFHVRPGVIATFRLPSDVTPQEVERLCRLLQSIPFR